MRRVGDQGAALAEKVAARWRREGIQFDSAATEQDLAQIEAVHGVRLPASFRALWSLSDGTATDDDQWLIFGQVSNMVQRAYGLRTPEGVHLVFADWKLGTAVALVLSPDDHGVVIFHKSAEPIAASFDAFLELYLTEQPIWPRPGASE